jgi:peroxiredoxin
MRKLMPLLGGILLGLGVGIVIFFGFLKEDSAPKMSDLTQGSVPQPVPSLDAPAPDFELSTLSGESIQLEDYRGKIVLLNFWATWCAPCRLEMPALQSRYEEHNGKLAVVAINNAESPEDVQAFVDELDLSFDILLDPQAEAQRLYQVRGYPTSFLIDADGVIRTQHIGLMTEGQLDGYLKELGLP